MANGMERQDIYTACLEAAIAFGGELGPRLTGRARELMLQRAPFAATEYDRASLVESERFLSLRQDTFCAAYPDALRAEFTNPQVPSQGAPKALSFESLELMEEEQVDETVEVLRGQQAVLAAVEADLAVLNALISAAQGHRVVSAAANPFRPDAWVRALRSAAMECRVPPAVRARWLHALCEALGPELADGYRLLCGLLRRHGVAAASFVVNPAGAGSGRAPAQGPRIGAATPAPSAQASVLNVRDLRRFLHGDAASHAGATAPEPVPSPQDHPMTVPWAFEALQEIKGADDVLRRMQQRRASGRVAMSGQVASDAALSPGQALGQEVVRVMIENMTADQRLPAPVRQAILDLQPALLRLVRNDPRFFRDQDHPTRRLLSEITERSLAWPSSQHPGFAGFFRPVCEAVDALAAVRADTAEPFAVALESLEQAWAHEEARARQQRARAAQALIQAEKRNLLAQTIADELKLRPDVAAAPAQIRRFVAGPWSQVIAAARMRQGGTADAQACTDIINDLIWTTQPRLASENRARLARLAPAVMASLRAGLAAIDYPAAETQRLLDYVSGLHQIALGPQPAEPAPLSRDELDARMDQGSRETWLQPQEARDSGLMEWEPLPAHSAPGRLAASDAPAAGDASVLALEQLHTGVWVDLLLGGTWSRWRLAWAGSHSLLFMFTDGDGGSRSMTRGTLARMIADGAVRLVADEPVLSGALDAVASRALRNTMDTMR